MGLNPKGRGRGRGGKGSFSNKGRRGRGMGGQGPMFRACPPGMFCPPPMGFPPEPPFGGGPYFPGPSGFNFGPPRPGFGKFPRKNFKRKVLQKNNEPPIPEIDLTKPWVTDEIKSEDAKKQECLETWRKSKDDEDWSKYKSQKHVVKTLYDKAKEEYLANHLEEASIWLNTTQTRNYYCEICDKSFRCDDDLILHEAEHEICGRDGCEFTAHPKVIAKHVKMQHDSGLYKRIGKLYTEEEIAKWIEERKKRYPSKKVIEEKKTLEQEKQERGERIKVDNSRFNKSFQKKKTSVKDLKERVQSQRRKKKRNRKLVVHSHAEDTTEFQRRGIPAFLGIGSENKPFDPDNKKEKDIDISDDEWIPFVPKMPTIPLMNNSLGLLASAYDSDEEATERGCQKKMEEMSDDGEGPPEEVKTICVKASSLEGNAEEIPRISNRSIAKRSSLDRSKKKPNNSISRNDYERRNLTLLEKLLRNEIRHERNVILQCIHYVVKNGFFT